MKGQGFEERKKRGKGRAGAALKWKKTNYTKIAKKGGSWRPRRKKSQRGKGRPKRKNERGSHTRRQQAPPKGEKE